MLHWNARSAWTIAALVIFWPLGLLLVWRFAPWQTRTKRIVTGALVWPLGAWWLSRSNRGAPMKVGAWVGAAVWTLFAAAFIAALMNPQPRIPKQQVAATTASPTPAKATSTPSAARASATAEPSRPTVTASPTAAPSTTPPPAAPTSAPTTAPASPTTADVLRDYLRQNFGMPGFETSWYRNIKDVRIDGRTVTVSTDLFPDTEGKRLASPICSGVSGFVYANDSKNYGLSAVDVRGQSNQPLIYRSDLGGRC